MTIASASPQIRIAINRFCLGTYISFRSGQARQRAENHYDSIRCRRAVNDATCGMAKRSAAMPDEER